MIHTYNFIFCWIRNRKEFLQEEPERIVMGTLASPIDAARLIGEAIESVSTEADLTPVVWVGRGHE